MEAWLALVGAVVGGLLVLVGDAVRRRAERRRDEVLRLAEAATTFAVAYGRLLGQRRDALITGERPTDARAERYEVDIRFFMTPGSDQLREPASAVARAYHQVLNSWDIDDHQAMFQHYREVSRNFEAEVRRIVARGSLPRQTRRTPRMPRR